MKLLEFAARYHGYCKICKEEIFPGQKVAPNGDSGFAHAGCIYQDVVWDVQVPDDELVAPLARPLCEKCFVELPVSGICGFCS